jgi:hypothetical protein
MNKIALPATEFTPSVTMDHINFKFEIKGESSPEDARQFYSPLIKWVDDFGKYLLFLNDNSPGKKKETLVFTFHLDYVTSSSLKNIYDLLKKIESLQDYVHEVKIYWIYDAEDEDMKDNGLEFAKMLKMPFDVAGA